MSAPSVLAAKPAKRLDITHIDLRCRAAFSYDEPLTLPRACPEIPEIPVINAHAG